MDEDLDKEVNPAIIWADKNFLHSNDPPVCMSFSFSPEAITTMGLVQSDNKCLNKTIAVFVQLCLEIRELSCEGSPLLKKCLLVNEELCEISQKNDENDQINIGAPASMKCSESNKIDEVSLSSGVITQITNFMDLFLHAKQFTDRCFTVICEIIKQFSALFDIETSTYIKIDYSSLHFQVSSKFVFIKLRIRFLKRFTLQTVFNYLADVIILIIKFDSIFQTSAFRNIWTQYIKAILSTEKNIKMFKAKSGNAEKSFSMTDTTGLKNVFSEIEHLVSGNLFKVL